MKKAIKIIVSIVMVAVTITLFALTWTAMNNGYAIAAGLFGTFYGSFFLLTAQIFRSGILSWKDE